jgi:RNase P subunit RPR2
MTEEIDEAFCDRCDRDTRHRFRWSEHERDSSNDMRTCLVCGWYRFGFDGVYRAPELDDEAIVRGLMANRERRGERSLLPRRGR